MKAGHATIHRVAWRQPDTVCPLAGHGGGCCFDPKLASPIPREYRGAGGFSRIPRTIHRGQHVSCKHMDRGFRRVCRGGAKSGDLGKTYAVPVKGLKGRGHDK